MDNVENKKLYAFIAFLAAIFLSWNYIMYSIIKEPVTPNLLGGGADYNNYETMSTSTNSAVSQGSLVLTTSTGRLYALFVSKSATAIDLNISGSNSADNYTVRLNGVGASYEILPENMYTGAVYASSSSATTLSVTANQ